MNHLNSHEHVFLAEISKKLKSSPNLFWAELAVSVNTILSQSGLEFEDFKEPKIRILSNSNRDIVQLLAFLLFQREEQDQALKFLVRLEIENMPTVRNQPELLLLCEDYYMKQYLINLIHTKGWSSFYSIFNWKQQKNNKKNIIQLLRLKVLNSGTLRSQISEPRRIGVGYRDKGSLPDDKRTNPNRFADFTKEHNVIQENRQIKVDTHQLLQGMLE